MGREYKISCVAPKGAALNALLTRLPSPIHRNPMAEIYNYRVEADGFYFVDHHVAPEVAAVALKAFLDSALSANEKVTISEP
ncbi:MAG: hypothetical protein EOP84_08535 [Verrucomicrobiaceae bacterium]|nr:MAG: hypothetical protein EOP84_08535 [Verrucomicrobiaceae bacterium]